MNEENETPEPTKPTTKKKPIKPELVVGSNQGEARRAAAALGLPKTAAIAIDQLTDNHLDQAIGTARVEGDNASGWAKLEGATTTNLLG